MKYKSFETFDILLVVMVIKVNRNRDHHRQNSYTTHIMMRKLTKVMYFGAEKRNLQIKSVFDFSREIVLCDWLLEITVKLGQKFSQT